jgi:uncharacterized protein (DUF2062 family)
MTTPQNQGQAATMKTSVISTRWGSIRRAAYERVGKPILTLLRQGASPDRLAVSFALGAVIGIFPLVGATTAICAALAVLFRLNLPVIQIANYLVYPLQLALLIPFVKFGALLFQVPPPPLSLEELTAMFSADFWGTFASFFGVIARAAAAWAVVSLPVATVLSAVLVPLFRRFQRARIKESTMLTSTGS